MDNRLVATVLVDPEPKHLMLPDETKDRGGGTTGSDARNAAASHLRVRLQQYRYSCTQGFSSIRRFPQETALSGSSSGPVIAILL
jgi:hypothetical protein